MRYGPPSCPGPSRQGGFVLVATLWVMVIVAIAAGYFAQRVATAVDLARQARQNSQSAIDMASARAEVLYRLGTTSLTEYGLGRGDVATAMDNRPYRTTGDVLVRLQDSRGLFNLNVFEDDRLFRFLGTVGVEGAQRARMIATLRDYIDPDKLHRLNGAEDDEYRALGLPPPANRNLITPWEASRIIAWRDKPDLWRSGQLADLTTTSNVMGLNPNTAPLEVLATLPGVTQETAQAIINRRRLTPITDLRDIAALTGLSTHQLMDEVAVIPSNAVRITQSAAKLPWALQYTITLTPLSHEGPWRQDYFTRVQISAPQNPSENATELPKRSEAPPEQNPV